MFKNLFRLVILLGFYMFFTTSVLAASNLSVAIQQPKSPINQTDFTITFVSLDITNKPVTVKCFKKGPSDASFDQFGPAINLSAGGDTNNCVVDSSIINAVGIYEFYVTASTDSETINSSVVKIDYNNVNPGNPTNYSKEKIGSCDYKIKFKTADDNGKTIKVVIYRSDSPSFKANSSTEINTTLIGSNTDGEITNSVPDCSKTYYFVLKAVDNWGNNSDLIGDSFTTIVPDKKDKKVSSDSGIGAIPISKIKKDKTGAGDESSDSGSILGEASYQPDAVTAGENKGSDRKNMYFGLIILCILLLAYVERKQLIKILRQED